LELKFQHALYGVGTFLVLLGFSVAVFRVLSSGGSGEIADMISSGFTSAFFALFSGVLIGVGAALFINGLLFSLRGNAIHIVLSIFLLLAFAVAGIVAISDAKSVAFHTLAVFFACMAASGAFLLSALAFALSGLLRDYSAKHPPDHNNNKD
jgi:hypothetical protein